jgi:hypothetical protein
MIDVAVRANSGHCMVAEAIKIRIPDARVVSVDVQTIRWSNAKRRLRYMALTPRSVQAAIINFDQGLKPKPFKFRLTHAQVAYMKGTKFEHTADGGEIVSKVQTKEKATKTAKMLRKITSEGTRAEIHIRSKGKNETGRPLKVGGRLPPRMGLRRGFGIRAFNLGEGAEDA